MAQIPRSLNWGHLGLKSLAEFAGMSASTFAQQQVSVDQGDGTSKSYLSNGVAWNQIDGGLGGGTVEQAGIDYLVMPDGSLMPLSIMAGTPYEPLVAGAVQQTVLLDAGSDIDHAEILYTLNCGTNGVPDNDLASARFTSPDGNAEVVKTALTGAVLSGEVAAHQASTLRILHFGLRGAGPYTVAAGNTLTLLQMVVMALPAGVVALEIRFGSSTVGGGVNRRYRSITVTGYAS